MNWTDEAVVLLARPHGETAAIVQLLTRTHGRHAGLVRGGQGSRHRAVYQPGNKVSASWRGRLAEHLGTLSCELMVSHAARILDDPGRLTALAAITAVLEQTLPEREPHPGLYDGLLSLLDALEGDHWGEVYVSWELALLAELGFGLDLSTCAAGGDAAQLTYVSPKSGRAVSRAAGAPYQGKLLALPQFLLGNGEGGEAEVADGLELTGYFLHRHIFRPHAKELPEARLRLARMFRSSLQ